MYLARRDKKGVKILNVFWGDVPPTRVKDIKALNLPSHLERQVIKRVHKERMLWELWIDSAEDFTELRESLKRRGYKNLPTHGPGLSYFSSVATEKEMEKETVKITAKQRIMLRKRDANPGA